MESNKVPLREGVYYNSTHSCLENPAGDIHLTPNEKKILEIILDNRGRKDIIIEEIWHQQGIIVSESSYHQLVKMLRRKFVAAGLPTSCLKTIPRYGMVYLSEAEAEDEAEHIANHCGIAMNEEMPPEEHEALVPKVWKKKESRTEAGTSQVDIGEKDVLLPVGMLSESNYLNNFKIEEIKSRFKIPYFLSIFIFILSSAAIILLLMHYNTQDYFVQVKKIDNVGYHIAPTAKLSEALWQRIESSVMPVTKEVYIASNGPKVWVAYCENDIYKDNVPCTYEHFSLY